MAAGYDLEEMLIVRARVEEGTWRGKKVVKAGKPIARADEGGGKKGVSEVPAKDSKTIR